MSDGSTDRLVSELVQDARPVRLVGPLRAELAAVAAVALGISVAVVATLGLRPAGLAGAPGDPSFVLVAVGLATSGCGALLGALALGRPGLERAASLAALAAVTVLALCAGAAAFGLARGGIGDGSIWGGAEELPCMLFSVALALPVALFATYRVSRAAPLHRWRTALFAGAGAAGLGTLSAHLTCRTPGAWHTVVTHALTPLLGGLVLALLLYLLLRRWARAA